VKLTIKNFFDTYKNQLNFSKEHNISEMRVNLTDIRKTKIWLTMELFELVMKHIHDYFFKSGFEVVCDTKLMSTKNQNGKICFTKVSNKSSRDEVLYEGCEYTYFECAELIIQLPTV